MTTAQMNAEALRLMDIIAEDESDMKRVIKYLRSLVSKKQDETLMTKEEFLARVDRGIQEVREGKVTRMLPGETMDDLLRRKGYAV